MARWILAVLANNVIELDPCCCDVVGCIKPSGSQLQLAYNDSAFYSEVFLLKQPNLYFLSTLEKSKYKILRSIVVCLGSVSCAIAA